MSQRLSSLFAGRSAWFIAMVIVAFLFLFFLGSVELLHYTESTAFCTSCHTMDPEHAAYEISPHQNVDCGTCHIGPGAIPAVQAKLASVRYLWTYPLNLYPRPIPSPVKSLRPVEVVCEQCHWPQKFYTDRLLKVDRFAQDEANSRSSTYLLLKTGGGSTREGLGKGIHWHIENTVRYRAADQQLQDIPWVQVEIDGQTIEYVASDTNLSSDQINALPVHEMDCVDCHNRATHVFLPPDEAIDQAMSRGQLDASLPYLKREGTKLLTPFYETQAAAAEKITSELTSFYSTSYPDVSQAAVEDAAKTLTTLYDQIKFPDMKTDWQAHPNNIGHKDYPGCFRCHDGQHFSADKESIRLECNICHNIPQVAAEGSPPPLIPAAPTVPEPWSHRDTNWLALHRNQFDQTCSVCHDTSNAGGADDSSFCANSACHGTKWQFAGLDAPGILEISSPTQDIADQAAPMPHPVKGQEDCLLCHGPKGIHPFPADHVGRSNDICTGCHLAPPEPTVEAAAVAAATETSQTATVGGPPAIPHTLEGHQDCVACHGLDGIKPFPADHAGRTSDTCQACHKPAAASQGEATPTPEPLATAEPTATLQGEVTSTREAQATEEAAAEGPPTIPHTLEGRADCLACHGLDGIKPFPADHAGRTSDTCQACHKPAPVSQGEATPTSRPQATAEPTATLQGGETSTPALQATEEAASEGPPTIPHTLEGRADCLVCHGLDGIQPFPADHAGRTSDTCQACHKPAAASQGETTPTSEPQATAEPTATLQGEVTSTREAQVTTKPTEEGPPPIPHSLEGREDCLVCHGLNGIKPFPADHARRTPVMCPACHELQGEEEN
jgi:mono/diheme cytochrome c family protein